MISTLFRVVIATITIVFFSASSARAGLIAYWTLDDNTAGLQNLGSNGSASNLATASGAGITGTPTFTSTGGAMGGYATFNGNAALVANAAGNAADSLPGYPFTMAAWVRPALHPSALADRLAAVGMSLSTASNVYYTVGVEATQSGTLADSNDVQAVRRNTTFTSTEGLGTSGTVFDGNWHHIAVVNTSATNSVLYMDGVQVGTNTTANVTFNTSVNTVSVGAFLRSAGYIDKFYGDVDEARIYDTALSPQEIAELVPEASALWLVVIITGCVTSGRIPRRIWCL